VGKKVNTCDLKGSTEMVLIEGKTSNEGKPLKSAVRVSEADVRTSESRDKLQAMLVQATTEGILLFGCRIALQSVQAFPFWTCLTV
jgi:hypothetical protein